MEIVSRGGRWILNWRLRNNLRNVFNCTRCILKAIWYKKLPLYIRYKILFRSILCNNYIRLNLHSPAHVGCIYRLTENALCWMLRRGEECAREFYTLSIVQSNSAASGTHRIWKGSDTVIIILWHHFLQNLWTKFQLDSSSGSQLNM